jgi:cellulose synthase/poly-beta-1,6-N-acetylglucosamine synthase-like glycosyltransferase
MNLNKLDLIIIDVLATILTYLYNIASAVMIFFLVFPGLCILISRLIKVKKPEQQPLKQYDFGTIITAYRNADIAKPLVESLIRQDYSQHHVYLVADDCDLGHFDLRDERFTLLRPEQPLHLKAKSIIYAIEHFVRNHEYIVIFDADNLAHPRFYQTINLYANEGHTCIQGQRTAKNLDSMYACADATGEFYKNYVERYLPPVLGSSSVISGSGMATQTKVYKDYIYGPEISKGKDLWKKMLQEDKILQNHLLDRDLKITYAKDAIVYDEKVSTGDAVETQRSRWLFSYFQNLRNSSRILLKGISNLSFNQFLFGIITIAPPLFILIFISLLLFFIGLLVNPFISLLFLTALAIFAAGVLWSLYLSQVPAEIWKALWAMPLFIWRQIKALFKMGNPNKNFKHSEHKVHVTIDEVLKKQG